MREERRSYRATVAGILIGIGMDGFVDGIVLHQIAQWHNMLSNIVPPHTMDNMRVSMTWDGLGDGAPAGPANPTQRPPRCQSARLLGLGAGGRAQHSTAEPWRIGAKDAGVGRLRRRLPHMVHNNPLPLRRYVYYRLQIAV
jgi:Predicted membrane protein (DUF2243)